MFKNNKNLVVIGIIALVNALGYGIIIPILYSYSQKFGLNDFQNGLLFALFSLCQFLSAPIIGRMSDKFGRKPLLLLSLVGTVVSFVMLAFAPNAIILFIARALDGLTAGNIPVAAAVISDTTEAKDRAKGFGIIGASFGFGFLFGPAISGMTVGFGMAIPFLIAAAVSFVAVVATQLFLPETNKHIGEVKAEKLFDVRKLVFSLFDPSLGKALSISLIYAFAFGLFIYAFQPFSVKVMGLGLSQISFIFVVFGLIGLISQVLIIPRVTKILGEKKALVVSLLITSLSFISFSLVRNIELFVLIAVINSLANGFVGPLVQTHLSKEVDVKSQGSIQGLNASYNSLGSIFGPIVGGIVASVSIPAPFFVGGVAILGCLVISLYILKEKERPVHLFS